MKVKFEPKPSEMSACDMPVGEIAVITHYTMTPDYVGDVVQRNMDGSLTHLGHRISWESGEPFADTAQTSASASSRFWRCESMNIEWQVEDGYVGHGTQSFDMGESEILEFDSVDEAMKAIQAETHEQFRDRVSWCFSNYDEIKAEVEKILANKPKD